MLPSSCLRPLSGPVAALQNATNLATLKRASIYHVEVLKVRSTLMGLGMELIWFNARLACKKPWVRSSILYKLSVVGDVKAGGLYIESHPQLHREFKTGLGCTDKPPSPRRTEKKPLRVVYFYWTSVLWTSQD